MRATAAAVRSGATSPAEGVGIAIEAARRLEDLNIFTHLAEASGVDGSELGPRFRTEPLTCVVRQRVPGIAPEQVMVHRRVA